MNVYLCDSCGKRGVLAPQTQQKMVEVKEEINGEIFSYKIPETKTIERRNPISGDIEQFKEPVLEYLEERIIRVYLEVGFQERVTREFCTQCFEGVKNEIKILWDKLNQYEPI